MKPPLALFRLDGFHRLISARYSEPEAVLRDLAGSDDILEDILLLERMTNDRARGEQRGLAGVSIYELVYFVPNASIVNAAFTHTSETGSRFNGRTRGAWYAAEELATSIAEVTYHKGRRLAQIVAPKLPGQRPDRETSSFVDWLADFRSEFHTLTPPDAFADCLQPEPVPECYAASQQMARELIAAKSNGIVYPSVRRQHSPCIVCFRPALVYNPHRGEELEISLQGTATGYDHEVRTRASAAV